MSIRVAFAYHFHDRDWFGGRNYFASLFSALAIVAPADMQVVFITGEKIETTLPDAFPWLEVIRTPLMDRWHPSWLLRQVTLHKFETDPLLDRFLVQHSIDVLSHSGYLRSNSTIKSLPWLYDFQFMHFPEYWKSKHIKRTQQYFNAACKHGSGVIVSSYDALNDLRNFAPGCKLPQHVLQFVSSPVDLESVIKKENILQKYALPDKYFYLPNQFWTNKNHRLAVDALTILKREGVEANIVCTGKTFDGRKPAYFEELKAHCKQSDVIENFKILGVVPYADTQALMAHAHAVINPSCFEGWSTTVEEAKTFRKRLLLSDIPVHREQAPTEGRYFSLNDPCHLAELMRNSIHELVQNTSAEQISAEYDIRLRSFGVKYLNILESALNPPSPESKVN
jgi:glycosyltransferase involved in cell wall biosynthesis